MHTLYILQSTTTGRYYVGVTSDFTRRIEEHNRGKSLATRGRGPWEIVYTKEYDSGQEAKLWEYQIKQKKRRSYIEWLINSQGNQSGSLA